MAVKLLECLVLRGVRVLRDVAAEQVRTGSNPANEQTLVSQFPWRPRSPRADYQPSALLGHAGDPGMDTAADRAGRPSGGVGLLASRSSARISGQAIHKGWFPVAGKTCPAVASVGLAQAKRAGSIGQVLAGWSQVVGTASFGPASSGTLLPAMRSTGCTTTSLDRSIPASGTPIASTRGKGAC
jgi:hypothetical protein